MAKKIAMVGAAALAFGMFADDGISAMDAIHLAASTYQKVHKTIFSQPFLYTKLNTEKWQAKENFISSVADGGTFISTSVFTPWDLTIREKDLKLFIKVPVSCRSSITVLEGDFTKFNDVRYAPVNGLWQYKNNRSILNFNPQDIKDLNNYIFEPISQIQLLAFNTGESYPFADRLIEYLSGSAITPVDEISDNITRIQKVMKQNNYYFKIEGLWEQKMQNILYDYLMNSWPTNISADTISKPENDKTLNKSRRSIEHPTKSTLFDVLGYADKDIEKWYASWKKENGSAVIGTSLQNVDIYNGLYDI